MPEASPQAVLGDLAAALGVTELVPLAQGGQKFVLRALREGTPVAVKAILVPPGPAYAVAAERAARETDVLAAVDSPRLVRLISEPRELRFAGNLPYGVAWAEELLDGVDVDKLLGTPWQPTDAARLLVHVAEALAALHAAGIVHRDVNPGNVRRRNDGGYVLMDLGLAHFLAEQDPGDADGIGTVGHLSPEHAPGASVLPPSDVYCLGILVHQALTGELPSTAPTLPPDTPEALARIVERCLRPDPAERFADGGALLDELALHPDVFRAASLNEIDPPTALFDLKYVASCEDTVLLRGAFGERRLDVETIARDQEPFAVRLLPGELEVAPGVRFAARTIELGGGRITNSYELMVDTRRATVGVHSGPDGFYLPDLLSSAATIAAISGSFSYISDDFDYEPAEFCLDFCARDGVTVSLPTVTKPAFKVGRDGVWLGELEARGTLRIGDREYGWIGSKERALSANADDLVVFGAANCRVEYTAAKRTALLRRVGRAANRTPQVADVVDLVVHRQVVSARYPGGGADLFEGSFVLRGRASLVDGIRVGDEVEIRSVGGIDRVGIESGFSVGPSVAAAAQGDVLDGYDASLGVSPFLPGARYARTLISLADDLLRLRVLDGAPLSRTFQGVSCSETAQLVAADGLDPAHVYHLDGGQSSKLAFVRDGVPAVFGSMHYLLWPKQDAGDFLWRGTHGRLLRSALRVSAHDSTISTG
jgi:Protein kinase domain